MQRHPSGRPPPGTALKPLVGSALAAALLGISALVYDVDFTDGAGVLVDAKTGATVKTEAAGYGAAPRVTG